MTEPMLSATEESPEATGEASPAEKVETEFDKLVKMLGNAIAATADEVTNFLWIQTDCETRRYLDLLVKHGAAKNRQEAAAFLIAAGIESNQQLFEKIEHTNTQIASLRSQLRAESPSES